jgi:hypothetical protein
MTEPSESGKKPTCPSNYEFLKEFTGQALGGKGGLENVLESFAPQAVVVLYGG